ncbi:MAG: SAM-dependent methyltransferase [Pseudomonadota bacterium]
MTELKALILADIAKTGPMPLDQYMTLCLAHPEHGYYMTKEPFGRDGDFITAPEISQMFGELIGLWIGDLWTRQGQPDGPTLIELGPGRGTLMADARRSLEKVPLWPDSPPHFVETSSRLRMLQAERHTDAIFHETIETAPSTLPLFMVANELFDALPIRQMEMTAQGWKERAITANSADLAFTLIDYKPGPDLPTNAKVGDIFEVCPAADILCQAIAERIMTQGGAVLIVDYGYTAAEAGDSFQAIEKHRYADPLANPGTADLTAHVNFAALAGGARAAGCAVHGPVTQGHFLGQLGLPLRARALGGSALRDAARLMDGEAMGTLFKVLAFTQPGSPPPAGFA